MSIFWSFSDSSREDLLKIGQNMIYCVFMNLAIFSNIPVFLWRRLNND